MAYDPFLRGPFPVGVHTTSLCHLDRERVLPTEIWYPAVPSVAGRDLAAESRDRYELLSRPMWQLAVRDAPARVGGFPLVVFSHGFGGHRRQSTFVCTHLASHGYIVAAIDHPGDTAADHLRRAQKPLHERKAEARAMVESRPEDLIVAIDQLLAGRGGPATLALDALGRAGQRFETARAEDGQEARVAVMGHSFGGFTALAGVSRDPRIAVLVGLAPAGGSSKAAGALARRLGFDWRRIVPTLFIAGDKDSVLPVDGIHDLFDRVEGPKRMAVISDADHFHFCDAAGRVHELFRSLPPTLPLERPLPPWDTLCSERAAQDVIRGLTLAHLDAFLRELGPARDFLAGNLVESLGSRGAQVEVS